MSASAKTTEDIQTLVDLGLSCRQAKIYLALSLLGKATINALSSTAKMDRANVYRTMKQLKELKLVQVVITNPVTFEALPLNDVVLLLLEHKKSMYDDVKVKAKNLLRKHRKDCISNADSIENQIVLVPGGGLTIKKIGELVDSTKRSHEGILYVKDLHMRPDFFSDLFSKLLFNNVRIKIIVSPENGEKLPAKIPRLRKNENFEIRIADSKPQVTFSMWDTKKVFLTITPKISEPMTDGLFIQNCALVDLIQEYFELRWVRSKPI